MTFMILKKFLLFLLPITFFVIGLRTIPHYGINWDAPEHYIRGQSFLHFFLTGKRDYADLPKLRIHYDKPSDPNRLAGIQLDDDKTFRRSIYQYDRERKRLTFDDWLSTPGTHPPLNDILAASFNYIFYQKLGIMGDIESYQLFPLVVSTITAAALFLFISTYYGLTAGIVAYLALVTYPLFWAESHFNIKDPPETAFYTLTLLTFFQAVTRRSVVWLIVAAIATGLALGTKFNIFFALPSVALWFVMWGWSRLRFGQWPLTKRFTLALLVVPLISIGIFWATYPNLWTNPWQGFLAGLEYYKTIGFGVRYQPAQYFSLFGINVFPLQLVMFTTPLVTFVLALLGICYALVCGWKEKRKTALFLFFWWLIPIVRVSLPSSGIYAGGRQIMEYIPPMAALAGIGAKQAILWLLNSLVALKGVNKTFVKSAASGFMVLLFVPIVLKIISIHPNENVYFNSLIGGLLGARERNFPDWGVTLGSVYQQGVTWLNNNAEPQANVSLVKGLLSNVPRIMFRSDINFIDRYWSGRDKQGEYLMEVIDYYWERDIPFSKRQYLETLNPVYEVRVDNVAILRIWKNDMQHAKKISP